MNNIYFTDLTNTNGNLLRNNEFDLLLNKI